VAKCKPLMDGSCLFTKALDAELDLNEKGLVSFNLQDP